MSSDSTSSAPVAARRPHISPETAAQMWQFFQIYAWPFAIWFKPICLATAALWLVYRAYHVVNKPLDELAQLLGYDVPPTPLIDLAGIKSDGAIIHWTVPEKQKLKTTLKYEIHLNGVVIDSVASSESAVTITGLQPGGYYVVRVALVNSSLSSRSTPIRFRSKPASSSDTFATGSEHGHETEHESGQDSAPRIKAYRGLKDIAPPSPEAAPPMTREGSSQRHHQRSINGNRPSPAALGIDRQDPVSDSAGSAECEESIHQLTERLDTLRQELEDVERQSRIDEEEDLKAREELNKERDELKAELSKKDKASKDLKKEVGILERQNTSAQNEKEKQKRTLAQKQHEYEKLKEDTKRWERETVEFKADGERIQKEQADRSKQFEQEREELRLKQAEASAAFKALDDEFRGQQAEIKKIERAKNSSPNGAEPERSFVQQQQQEAEEDRQWNVTRAGLNQQYSNAAQRLESIRQFHRDQVSYLEQVRDQSRRQQRDAQLASANSNQERQLGRGDSQRSRHGTAADSPSISNFPTSSSSPFGNGINAISPGFPHQAGPSPFLNISNGMTIAAPTADISLSDEEKDKLTGGAPMSPGTGAGLIPADLFSNDDNNNKNGSDARSNVQPLPGLGALPGLGGIPGLGQQPRGIAEHPSSGPASPASIPSRPASTFASPQASQNNIHLGSPDAVMDSDRRSIRSNRSNRAISGSGGHNGAPAASRFQGIFGMKQRSKTSAADDSGLALGKAQSHSMPRQDQGLPGLDTTTTTRKRNSSISGGLFGGALSRPGQSGVEGSQDNDADRADGPTAKTRRPFAFFSQKADGWPSSFTSLGRRPASPRPGSTHSTELPRPSLDSSRWGVDSWANNDAASGARNSPLSFGPTGPGPGWGMPSNRSFGSRHPSRRPSIQQGASSGPPEDIIEDSDSDALDPKDEPHLAPIGTKPATTTDKEPPGSPHLNPNAKDFRSFFSSMKPSSSKNKDTANANVTAAAAATSTTSTPGPSSTNDAESPPISRKSRSDVRSLAMSESTTHDSNSARPSNEYFHLTRTPSHSNSYLSSSAGDSSLLAPTNSCAANANNTNNANNLSSSLSSSFSGKETLMQKIQRKSSSGKFSLPAFTKRDRARLASSASAARESAGGDATPLATPADEGDEETQGLAAGGSGEGRGSFERGAGKQGGSGGGGSGSGRGWSNVLKLGKGKEREREREKEKEKRGEGESEVDEE
ncbi:hypothetical protein MBLNU230_g8579t1 [Neophaeotheca triangularis]